MRRLVTGAIGVLWALVSAPTPGAAQQGKWVGAKCDIKPGHYLVNSAVLYLRTAVEGQFADQKEKDLRDALRVLGQALQNGQQKNPAAWYYLGRYYVERQDAAGADSAFAKATALAPACATDVNTYRRQLWVPIVNAGIAAWQAGNTDSAITALRRANQVYAGEPTAFAYLASLLANASQPDSAIKYFQLAIQAASDPKFAKEKKDAMFNVARVYHVARRWDDAVAAYTAYLKAYPNDIQATAGLASAYAGMGKRDEAKALYARILARADSVDPEDLFAAGQEILSGIAPPDTAAQGGRCRSDTRRDSRSLTVRQIAARCDSLTRKAMRDFDAGSQADYRLVEQAFEAGLARNPSHREALFRLAGTAALSGDTARALPAARRLYQVDPLNRGTIRMVAQVWQIKGKGDSTIHYLQLADSIPLEVTVTRLSTDEHGATLQGSVTNFHTKPTTPLDLAFELLNAKGETVTTVTQSVAALNPTESRSFELKGTGAGIVAWRYRLGAR